METEEKKHPLANWQPFIEREWEKEWVPAFERENSIAKKIGMLYIAFEMPVDRGKVIRYFLDLAENYDDGIRGDGDSVYPHDYKWDTPYGRMRVGRIRAVVAKKAFEILCIRFFKNDKREGEEPVWAGYIRDPNTMEAILHFFRLGKPVIDFRFANLPYSKVSRNEHHVATAAKFLQELVEYAWPYWRSVYDWRGEEFLRFEKFRVYYPQFIEVFHGLGKLNLLLQGKRFEWLNNHCLAVLEKLAFFGGKYDTLEEAMLEGSMAARVILNAKILHKEQKRQREIQQAKNQAAEAKAKLKKLQA